MMYPAAMMEIGIRRKIGAVLCISAPIPSDAKNAVGAESGIGFMILTGAVIANSTEILIVQTKILIGVVACS